MSTITITYHLSDAGQRKTLLEGQDGKRERSVTVPQGDPLYPRALALCERVDENGSATLDLTHCVWVDSARATIPGPAKRGKYDMRSTSDRAYDAVMTAEQLVADEEARYAAALAYDEAEEAAKRQKIADAEAADRAALREFGEALRTYQGEPDRSRNQLRTAKYGTVIQISNFPAPKTTDSEYADAYGAASEDAQRRQKDREVREVAERKDALRAWAAAHGSERLRALIEENFSWEGVAEDEFFASHMPEGFFTATDMPGDDWDRKTRTKPNLEEIQTLRRLRAVCEASKGVLTEPDLEFAIATYEEEDEDGKTREPEKFPMLSLKIQAPNGKTKEVFRRIE